MLARRCPTGGCASPLQSTAAPRRRVNTPLNTEVNTRSVAWSGSRRAENPIARSLAPPLGPRRRPDSAAGPVAIAPHRSPSGVALSCCARDGVAVDKHRLERFKQTTSRARAAWNEAHGSPLTIPARSTSTASLQCSILRCFFVTVARLGPSPILHPAGPGRKATVNLQRPAGHPPSQTRNRCGRRRMT